MARGCFFEGWYFKHQWEGHTIAFIPAHHRDGAGVETASLQIITEAGADCLAFPLEQFHVLRHPFRVRAGGCLFTLEGCRLAATFLGKPLAGQLRYGPMARPRGDIMGPFRFVPGLQCRHSVVSMDHTVEGTLHWGEEVFHIRRGRGYVEGDRGTSFPDRYLWTQCAFPGGSMMLAVADVPLGPARITGGLGFWYQGGQELRLATYRGLRVLEAGPAGAVVRQGAWQLEVEQLEANAQPLRAPVSGIMSRTIHESAACKVRCRLRRRGETVADLVGEQAGFEADWSAEGKQL